MKGKKEVGKTHKQVGVFQGRNWIWVVVGYRVGQVRIRPMLYLQAP